MQNVLAVATKTHFKTRKLSILKWKLHTSKKEDTLCTVYNLTSVWDQRVH
jgi:hypothetical protein